MWFIYNKGLKKEVLDSIKNREYSHEQLVSMFQELNQKWEIRKKGISTAMIIYGLCTTFVLATNIMNPVNTGGILLIVIASLNIFIIAFVFIKINIVNKSKRQFTSAIKKGYPELEKEFEFIL
ncbi:MAG: hypothetical protein RR745_06475 [Bacilli bacterium]